MRRTTVLTVALCGILGLAATTAAVVAVALPGGQEPGARGDQPNYASLRSLERLRWDCRSSLGRRELTLFGNGTLRVREGAPDAEGVYLYELDPPELEAYLNRLVGEDLGESQDDYQSVGGEWVEQCTLDLALPQRVPEHYDFGRYDSLPLALHRVRSIAVELLGRVDRTGPALGSDRLPLDYTPRVGDTLRRHDGYMFQIAGLTSDSRGIELHGVDHPLVIYIAITDLRKRFVALERRRN